MPHELPFLTSWREARETATEALFCPAMQGLPVGAASALAALPIHDANGCMLEALSAGASAPDCICVAVMAVDPLRQWSRILRRLRDCRLRNVLIWPSVGVLGADIQQGLAPHGLGFEREAAFVHEAADSGFRVTATAFSAVDAARMAAAGAHRILLHPPLPQRDERWFDKVMLDWFRKEAETISGLNVDLVFYVESAKPVKAAKRDYSVARYGG